MPPHTRNPVIDQARMLRGIGRDAPVILDIGANIGQTYTDYRRVFPASEIHCFEPFPEAAAQTRSVIGSDPRARVIEAAVADERGERTFYVNGRNATNSLLPRPNEQRRYYPEDAETVKEIKVPCVTIDEYVAEQGLASTEPGVGILKMDIQGGEAMAIRGAEALLRSGTVAVVQTEAMFVPHYEGCPLLKDIWALLEPYGYTLYSMYDLRLAGNGQLRFGDALFISSEVRERVVDTAPMEK